MGTMGEGSVTGRPLGTNVVAGTGLGEKQGTPEMGGN